MRTDGERASTGAAVGLLAAVSIVAVAPRLPWYAAIPAACASTVLGPVLGAWGALALGDWSDRR